MKSLGCYIHIPFCNFKCYYCDFLAYPCQDKRIPSYVQHLVEEIRLASQQYPDVQLDTIYLGGGTPSHLPPVYIQKILEALDDCFLITGDCEITMEANPEDINLSKSRQYRAYQINRISLGVQTFSQDILHFIGREHQPKQVMEGIEWLRKSGFTNINLDLMFGLPGQTLDLLEEDLQIIQQTAPTHVSVYGLTIEQNTHFHRLHERRGLNLPDEETERQMYHRSRQLLKALGFHHYEISNFSQPGFESRHNLKYWTNMEYLGFGLGSHSYYQESRFHNSQNLKAYQNLIDRDRLPVAESESITKELKIKEYILMHMRLLEGIFLPEFENLFQVKLFDLFAKEIKQGMEYGLLKLENQHLLFTDRGLDLSNQFFISII